MIRPKQLFFQCECGVNSANFTALYQSESGELCVMWVCDMCDKNCLAVVAYIEREEQPCLPIPLFTEEDKLFLKENHCFVKEEV